MGVGRGVHDVLQLYLRHSAGKVLAAEAGHAVHRMHQVRQVLIQHIQSRAEQALLKQALHLLGAAELGGLVGLPDGTGLLQHQNGVVEIIQQSGGFRVPDAQVLVQRLGHEARVQLGKICLHGFFHSAGPSALLGGKGAAQGGGGLGRVAEQHLPGGRDVHLLQRIVPALAEDVKAVQSVDLIAPELRPGGGLGIRREHVHNAAPHTELAGAFHLAAPVVARRQQPGGQLLHRDGHARL